MAIKSKKHLFIVDPIESLILTLDSSARIAAALQGRGHQIAFAQIQDLQWYAGELTARVHAQPIKSFDPNTFKPEVGAREWTSLAAFDAIHMRKDPPFDLDYITATWLLDSASEKVRIYNLPSALRSFNEKLAILLFPDCCRKALVSSDPEQLLKFAEEFTQNDAILKPLHLFGGRGVARLTIGDGKMTRDQALGFLRRETEDRKTPRLIQAFDAAIFKGEVRAFAVGGKPLAWCLKVPSGGNFLANTRAGAVLKSYEPTNIETERVTKIARKLQEFGIEFIGLDLIGGFVSEINITSPRLLVAPDDHTDYYGEIADWLGDRQS